MALIWCFPLGVNSLSWILYMELYYKGLYNPLRYSRWNISTSWWTFYDTIKWKVNEQYQKKEPIINQRQIIMNHKKIYMINAGKTCHLGFKHSPGSRLHIFVFLPQKWFPVIHEASSRWSLSFTECSTSCHGFFRTT